MDLCERKKQNSFLIQITLCEKENGYVKGMKNTRNWLLFELNESFPCNNE